MIGGIYHFSRVNFAYNSNKIECGRLTEMKNHFRLFDYIVDTIKNEQDIYKKVCEELLNFDLNE